MEPQETIPNAGFITRFLYKIAAVDLETLRRCPRHDWDNARAVAEIQLCVWGYQTALLSLIGHLLFAAPGQIRPAIIAGAAFIATFVLLIDSYMVMRSGWHFSGIASLKRAGIDISGGVGARVKAGIFLVIRLLLAVAISALVAIFLGLLVFGRDIEARVQEGYAKANAELISQVTAQVDGEIGQEAEAEKAQAARVQALSAQVAAARDGELNPFANDPRVKAAREEIAQILARQAKAEDELHNAEAFATNELGGVKGATGNSGQAGDGPRHKAAVEQAANARRRLQEITEALSAARVRLDAAMPRGTSATKESKAGIGEQRKSLEAALTAEEAKFSAFRDHLVALRSDREATLRSRVEGAPNHVPRDDGFLARIVALERMAEADRKIAAVILLLHLTSFGFELAAVLAKITSFVPTAYATLLAKGAYLRDFHAAEELAAELNGEGRDEIAQQTEPPETPTDPEPPFPPAPANDNVADGVQDGFDPFGSYGRAPQRRPRGRPRKQTLK